MLSHDKEFPTEGSIMYINTNSVIILFFCLLYKLLVTKFSSARYSIQMGVGLLSQPTLCKMSIAIIITTN